VLWERLGERHAGSVRHALEKLLARELLDQAENRFEPAAAGQLPLGEPPALSGFLLGSLLVPPVHAGKEPADGHAV
jgi:hypothetical protein